MPLTISLLTMVNEDETIINSTNFPLPTGLTHENLDPLLLAETAELEILYPEPTTLKTVIKAWATVRGPAWTKMQEALTASYSPISNYDRTESWTDTHNLTNTRTFDGDTTETVRTSDITVDSGTSSNTGSSSTTGSSTDTGTVAGFNSTDWTNKDKQAKTESGSAQTSGSLQTSGRKEISGSVGTTGTNDYTDTNRDTGTLTRSGHVSGNIGVTTNQQMIQAELELRQMDIYRIIINEFIKMFCLGVY